MRGRSTTVGLPHFAQTVFGRIPGRGAFENMLCADLAPCDLATDVIGPHQSVGEALGLVQPAGTEQAKDAKTTPERAPSTPSKQSLVFRSAWSNSAVTTTSVGCRLVFGGSALIDRLWAPDSGSLLRVRDQRRGRDRI
jgi:hypothetical protein